MDYIIYLRIKGCDIPQMGDWCCENIKDWSILHSNGMTYTTPSTWIDKRTMFRGLPEDMMLLTLKIKDDADAMAFKLRWI